MVRRRRMVRRYLPDPVDPAALRRVLDAARRGPSAGFAQGLSLVVVTDAARRRRIAEGCGEADAVSRGLPPWLSVAPVHVLPCVSPDAYRRRYGEADKAGSAGPDGWEVPYWWVDGGAALMLLLLAAVNEGLAAGFLAVRRQEVAPLVGLRDHEQPLGLVTLGHPHPDDQPVGSARRPRHPFAEVVRFAG